MRILITGGNGFLGKNLKKKISNDSNLYFFPSSSELNVLNKQEIYNYIKLYNIDTILHMAAKCGGILANKNSPADFLRDNTQMALNIYEAARECNVTKIYSLGSICSYPKYCPIPFKEDDIWNGAAEETNFPYGQAKRTLLMLHQTYKAQYGFKGAHLIPVNMYGPHDHFDLKNSHVIPALINKFHNAAKYNLPYVECWGTGTATREFLYVEDAVDVILKSILQGFDSDLPINIGTGKEISIKDLSFLIKDITNFSGEIVFNGQVSDGQPRRMLDVSRAKELLDWQYKTTLEVGLKATLDWYINL